MGTVVFAQQPFFIFDKTTNTHRLSDRGPFANTTWPANPVYCFIRIRQFLGISTQYALKKAQPKRCVKMPHASYKTYASGKRHKEGIADHKKNTRYA